MSQSIDSNSESCPRGQRPNLSGAAARPGPHRLAPAARVAHVEARDHAEDLVDRLKVVNVGQDLADVSADTCTRVPGLQGGPASPQQPHTSANPAASNVQMSDIDYVRLERRRARNRASQRKIRQKLRVRPCFLSVADAQLRSYLTANSASNRCGLLKTVRSVQSMRIWRGNRASSTA